MKQVNIGTAATWWARRTHARALYRRSCPGTETLLSPPNDRRANVDARSVLSSEAPRSAKWEAVSNVEERVANDSGSGRTRAPASPAARYATRYSSGIRLEPRCAHQKGLLGAGRTREARCDKAGS